MGILIIICQVAQCTCGEPDRKEAFNIGRGKTFAIVYNIDSVTLAKAACGGIFRSSEGFTRGCFAHYLSTDSAFIAKIYGVILAIEIAHSNNWQHIWLETDSSNDTLVSKKQVD